MLGNLVEIKKLNLPQGQYAIFGSSPLAVRNIRDSRDIDVIVKIDLWNNIIEKYKNNIKQKPLSIVIGDVEIYKDWLELTNIIDEMIDSAEIIKGLPFVKLKYVLQWKKEMAREKDMRDIRLINEYLNKNK